MRIAQDVDYVPERQCYFHTITAYFRIGDENIEIERQYFADDCVPERAEYEKLMVNVEDFKRERAA